MDKKEIKIQYYKDVNDCWAGAAFFIDNNSNSYKITHAAGAQMKIREAKAAVAEELEREVEEFCLTHPNFHRVNRDEYEAAYNAKLHQ